LIRRRSFLAQLGLLAAGGAPAWWFRDKVLWPEPETRFPAEGTTGWLPMLDPRQGVVVLEARLAGRTVRALLDSGAQSSVVDRGLVERLALPVMAIAPVVVAFGVSGGPQIGRGASLDLELGGLKVQGLRAAVLDLAPISSAARRPFDVILGQDLLHHVMVDLDFPNARLAFAAPEGASPPEGARLLPVRLQGRELMTAVAVEGVSIEVVLDTGASGALALSDETAEAAGLLDGRPVGRAPSLTFGGLSFDRVVRARTVEFADEVYRDVAVHVFTSAQGAPRPAGLLGVEALKRFRILIDAGRGRVHLLDQA
jgi:predicted aspartyl protease